MSDSLPNFSIGDFAESMLNSDSISPLHEAQAPTMPSIPGSNSQLDITNIEVPDDLMHEILGGESTTSYLNSVLEGATPQPSIPRAENIPVKEKVVNQTERLSALLEQLAAVLSETKELISEMAVGTAVSIGTSTAGTGGTYGGNPNPSKKKTSKKKRRLEHKSIEETVASVLKEMQDGRS